MLQNAQLELDHSDAENARHPGLQDASALRLRAGALARSVAWMPGQKSSRSLRDRCRRLDRAFGPLLAALDSPATKTVCEDFRWLYDNTRLLETELGDVIEAFDKSQQIPHVRGIEGAIVPRVGAIAEDFLDAAGLRFAVAGFTAYVEAFQEVTILNAAELWNLISVLKVVVLEQIVERGHDLIDDPTASHAMGVLVRSLREIGQTRWKEVIEPLILFDHILREDPAGAYARMDYDSRELYRTKIVDIARHSDCSEMEVAREAIALALQAVKRRSETPRVTQRNSHVGTYLLAEGFPLLARKAGYHPTLSQRLRTFLRSHPDDFYLPGIFALTFAIVSSVVLLVTAPNSSLSLALLSIMVLLLPSSQSAIEIMNYLVTMALPTEILPKLDVSGGIPEDCVTLVAVPTVLVDEKQVRRLVEDLEVRYLGNHDRNLHFALLSDLPDSPAAPQEDDPLVDLCLELIDNLNEKYADQAAGGFLLLHRHRIYNPREKLWMGWERKRGKLMDLNRLLSDRHDGFPRKAGDISVLKDVRFVITLDSDTELPRGSAHRMVGALAHPLNQAIIDPESGIVVAGYGILQPRVGVSVLSTSRSRLASIYSGQTGLDIYTRAVSDVYQDLYGEGSFVGKGIYEVQALDRVLDGRFPRNALLSHDLIEGAYARAGLVSDVEIIEDYHSHYNAYNRRKHRWVRGDWQITGWLRERVPEESGEWVINPLSVISRWKILDNLRRSLVEPSLFVLLILCWFVLPGGATRWTLAAVGVLFLPSWCQFAIQLVRAAVTRRRTIASDAARAWLDANITCWLTLTFLAHQALLSMDAVLRTAVRRAITRQRLLQWETAAQAELAGQQRTALDIYLEYAPVLALGLALILGLVNYHALLAAAPVLLLWGLSKPISLWLNRPTRVPRKQVSQKDERLLRLSALRIWRYFAEFSTAEHNWLIPDNVQEKPIKVAARISPTNLGFLFNARQVACEFGYLTVPELADQTLRTLATVRRMPRYRGHLLNWYDTRSLLPLPPALVSTVDSGNLVASLWTLQRGCLELLDRPVLQPALADGLIDYLQELASLRTLPRRKLEKLSREHKRQGWLRFLLELPNSVFEDIQRRISRSKHGVDASWHVEQAKERVDQVHCTVQRYTPWLRPEFAFLKNEPAIFLQRGADSIVLSCLPEFIDRLAAQVKDALDAGGAEETDALYRRLLSLLPEARSNGKRLIEELKRIADDAEKVAREMDFEFLLDPHRRLLSVGFDITTEQLDSACYDLLATESRIAVFAAIAKDDVPQESWFMLGRAHALDRGRPVLRSWSGTMFEYLMPALWMRVYPNTLLERSSIAAVRSHQAYAADHGIPWGISESAHARTDEFGNYQYHAFGIPQLAASGASLDVPVISPYSSFLALHVEPSAAIANLRRMKSQRWFGAYGFYEAIDYHLHRRFWFHKPEIVRCWMAHHQGMSLLSIANFLHDDVVQRWFHSHPRVQATELLLQEKPAAHVRPVRRSHSRQRAA